MNSLLEIIFAHIGQDASPKDIAPDRLACAETVSTILKEYLAQHGINFPIIIGTNPLLKYFEEHEELFERVYTPQSEDIVICATGTNTRPDLLPNGHAGFYINDNQIASNSSASGDLEINYTREGWRQLFHYYGGYPVKLFRVKKF